VGVRSRWLVGVLVALAGFGACWLGLAAARVWELDTQLALAAVPLAVILAVTPAWAERARERKPLADSQREQVSTRVERSPLSQVTHTVRDGSVVTGPGSVVFHLGTGADRGEEPLSGTADAAGECCWLGPCRRSQRRSSRAQA
jgi:hypothetical protein